MTVGVHRDFLCDVAWQLMDLCQDIDFHHQFMAEPYPLSEVVERLLALQANVAGYADRQLEAGGDEWQVTPL